MINKIILRYLMKVPALKTQSVNITYKQSTHSSNAVTSLNFSVEPGEFHFLCGSSGSGKSTTLELLCGLIPRVIRAEVDGDIRIFGKEIQSLSSRELAQLVGIVFQNPDEYFVTSSVETEVAFGLENLGTARSAMLSIIPEMLEKVGLSGFEKRSIASLSGGQKQRLAIGCCLAMNAEILLFDEPFINLDPAGSLELISLLGDLKKKDITIVFVTQRLFPELLALVDRMTLLQSGRMIYQGTPDNFLAQAIYHRSNPIYRAFSKLYGKTDELFVKDRIHGDLVVTLQDVSFTYPDSGNPALNGISCDFYKGEIVAVMGANGAGKSTLVSLINGLLKPQHGRVISCGLDTRQSSVANLSRHVGFMFQNPLYTIFSDTVYQEISFVAKLRGIPDTITEQKVKEISSHFGLSETLNRSPFVLSAGQQQRVAIASTVVIEPDVLILDEPTHGLDEMNLNHLEVILQDLVEKDHSVIVVTHDVDLAYRVANRIILLKDGKIIFNGPADEILCNEKLLKEASLVLPTRIRIERHGLQQTIHNSRESRG